MKTIKLLKNKGKYLIQLRITMKNSIRRKKQMKFHQKNIFLFKMLVTFLLQKPKLLMKYFTFAFLNPKSMNYFFHPILPIFLST